MLDSCVLMTGVNLEYTHGFDTATVISTDSTVSEVMLPLARPARLDASTA